jgi:hypothetical protein
VAKKYDPDRYQLMDITGETKLHFLTKLPIHQSKAGELLRNGSGSNLLMSYDQKTITISSEKKEIDGPQLERANGQVIYLIVH